MIDAVLSYHADPISCGVTRFSQQLAKRLEVPWGTLDDTQKYRRPLLSLKASEIPAGFAIQIYSRFDLFLHDVCRPGLVAMGDRVFAASAELANHYRQQCPHVISAWCPSLVEAQPREPITVLSFGMAHKIRTDLYETLKAKLDDTGENYVVYISAALHDGTTFADAAHSFEALRRLFGPRFVFLGTLSDEAMVDRLRTCTYVAAFFEKGLRENNTSVMAALEAGAMVVTNWDAYTPAMLKKMTYSIGHEYLPRTPQQVLCRMEYGWDKLVELIKHA